MMLQIDDRDLLISRKVGRYSFIVLNPGQWTDKIQKIYLLYTRDH